MKAWGLTDIGKVREVNQDTYRIQMNEDQTKGVFIVCDGMGGAKAGEVASRVAVEQFLDCIQSIWSLDWSEEILRQHLLDAYVQANKTVFDASVSHADYAGMGTTMVTMLVKTNTAIIGNVGDSRAYHLDENGMKQITEDHSLVSELMKRGDLTPYQASRHPSRNVITRAMGADATVKCDVFTVSAKPGDYILLCSDGLTGEVQDPEIYYEIFQAEHPENACQRLIDLAKSRGGHDNITLVLIAF